MRTKRIILIVIILIFPISALAHGEVPHFNIDAGTLPGGIKYGFELLGEWFSINLFTVSTKGKQERYLKQAEERLAEFMALYNYADQKEENLNKALEGYKSSLRKAEDMAEKIIFLDGNEIAIAYELENKTEIHEKVIVEVLEQGSPGSDEAEEVLAEARAQNEKIFKFIVEKYQFNNEDIEKNKAVISEELNFVEARAKELGKNAEEKKKAKEIADLLAQGKKYNKLGLTIQAYDFVKKAKDILY